MALYLQDGVCSGLPIREAAGPPQGKVSLIFSFTKHMAYKALCHPSSPFTPCPTSMKNVYKGENVQMNGQKYLDLVLPFLFFTVSRFMDILVPLSLVHEPLP